MGTTKQVVQEVGYGKTRSSELANAAQPYFTTQNFRDGVMGE